MPFAHLHAHTEYSLLDGSNKISEYVRRVKELGQTHAAITDHGVMYGVIDFYKEAVKEGITPILGCEVYVAPGSRFDKEYAGGDDRYHHLVLLAESNAGYANLMKICSRGFTEGFYHRPRVDMELLEACHEGIIALSACLAGEVQRWILRGLRDEAEKAAIRYRECFGAGNYFLEIQDHGIPEQKTVATELLNISKKLSIPLVATNDIHYTYQEDAAAHDVLLCIQTGKKLTDTDRMRYEGGQYYVKSEEEMRRLFPYALDAVANSAKIASRCQVEIEFHVPKLPRYDVPDGQDAAVYLRNLCYAGLKERYGIEANLPLEEKNLTTGGSPTVEESLTAPQVSKSSLPAFSAENLTDRLDFELDVITSMGFVDYFLIVWDFIRYARENDIIVGPGRGSAAGSLVAYCLHITNIEPISLNLLFERFLNPERVSMPDIDIDFCFVRREEVIDYVGQKYGRDHVVQIATFGTMAARGVIRDVGRVMELPYAFVDQIAKMIPAELGITLAKALEMNPEFRRLKEDDEQVAYLLKMAMRLEGLVRHSSTHAAGVVITGKPTEEYVPLSRGSEGVITTQFSMNTIEELGLLKMDFLGLRTLTVLQDTARAVKATEGIDIDLERLDFGDPAVYADIGMARTEGVFQLESAGMRSFMKELKPQSLEDIIAGISLYRPGPMDFIPKYIRNKNAPDAITYACPELEPILAPTYGCIVYQEQVMQIVRDLGGYTLGRSDLLRRAMSKKKSDVMQKERENFIFGNESEGVPGCVARGIGAEVASQIYDEMLDFAKYAFNKSHAACYAVISYQTAYLKHYYPAEFMAALLTSVIDNPGKVAEYIMCLRAMGIDLMAPDITEGEDGFSVAVDALTGKKSIRYSLTAIKGIGRSIVRDIVEERRVRGPYTGLEDFITRMSAHDINKKVIENLIKAGALDRLGGTRKQFMHVYMLMADYVSQNKRSVMPGQLTLFDIAEEDQKDEFKFAMPDVGEYDKSILLGFEKDVLGIYISGHPLEEDEELWKSAVTNVCADFYLDTETNQTKVRDRESVIIGGIVAEKTVKYTKNDKVMCFIQLEDLAGTCEVIVFPKDYESYGADLAEDARLFVKGRATVEEDKDAKLICEQIWTFGDVPKKVWVKFPNMAAYERQRDSLGQMLAAYGGKDSVVVYIEEPKQMKRLDGVGVRCDTGLIESLRDNFGAASVKVTGNLKK